VWNGVRGLMTRPFTRSESSLSITPNVELFAALCLVLVIEGLLPFLAPKVWRETMMRAAQLSDGQLRMVGLVAILLGLVTYWLTVAFLN
jgi:uncharacterized protein